MVWVLCGGGGGVIRYQTMNRDYRREIERKGRKNSVKRNIKKLYNP